MIITTEAFIIVICVALCCASVYSYFYKKIYCGFVKMLIEKNIVGEEKEVLLSELEISSFSAFFIKKALFSQTSALSRITSSKDDGKGHILVSLLPEKVEEAKKRFKDTKASGVAVIVSVVLCIVAAIIAILIYPTIENMIYNARNDFEAEEKYDENENLPSLPEEDDKDSFDNYEIPEENPEKLQPDSGEITEDEEETEKNEIPKIPETGNRFE